MGSNPAALIQICGSLDVVSSGNTCPDMWRDVHIMQRTNAQH